MEENRGQANKKCDHVLSSDPAVLSTIAALVDPTVTNTSGFSV